MITSLLKQKKVLITGGDGFVGSHLTRKLIKEGADVQLIREPDLMGKSTNLDGLDKYIDKYYVDICDFRSLNKAVKRANPEKIFHLAALADLDRSLEIANQCIEVNIKGTTNLLYALQDIKFDAFLFTSTCEVYGSNPPPFTEEMDLDPPSPYAVTKVAGEYLCKMFHKIYQYPIVILRLSTVYGPGQNIKRLIPSVIRSCIKKEKINITSGKQRRDFNYVEDIIGGIIKASITKGAIGEILNLGQGKTYTVREVVDKIVDLMGYSPEPINPSLRLRLGETMRWSCDNTKAQRILGWKPNCSLERGLQKTIDWYKSNPDQGTVE